MNKIDQVIKYIREEKIGEIKIKVENICKENKRERQKAGYNKLSKEIEELRKTKNKIENAYPSSNWTIESKLLLTFDVKVRELKLKYLISGDKDLSNFVEKLKNISL